MRYIRAPGPPKGLATNREAVSPDRRTYPIPTPRPARYSSPTTPAGTGCSHLSSTNIAAPAIGEPIGTTPDPGISGLLIDAHTVVSVGP